MSKGNKNFSIFIKKFYNHQFLSKNKTKVLDVGCADKFLKNLFWKKHRLYRDRYK